VCGGTNRQAGAIGRDCAARNPCKKASKRMPKVILFSLAKSADYVRFAILHGSDYEECRLLGHKTPVRTSQETHYVSTTESSQLMLCKI
jgi:hypothetical protein